MIRRKGAVMGEVEEKILTTAVSCCGARIVVRTKGQRWMCPCGRKHEDKRIDELCVAGKK